MVSSSSMSRTIVLQSVTISFTSLASGSSISKSVSTTLPGNSFFHSVLKVFFVKKQSILIILSHTRIVNTDLSKGKYCALRHIKAAAEQVLGRELHEIRNLLLVHELRDWGGVQGLKILSV